RASCAGPGGGVSAHFNDDGSAKPGAMDWLVDVLQETDPGPSLDDRYFRPDVPEPVKAEPEHKPEPLLPAAALEPWQRDGEKLWCDLCRRQTIHRNLCDDGGWWAICTACAS